MFEAIILNPQAKSAALAPHLLFESRNHLRLRPATKNSVDPLNFDEHNFAIICR
jgi:hypothetical protein